MGVIIETPQLSMEIKLISIDSLFIHEETIPLALEKLKHELTTNQVLKHPLIVDSDTLVVLDGMHRVAALKGLSCQLAPVCLVDYQNPAIELQAWYREFDGNVPFTDLTKTITTKTSFDLVQTLSKNAYEIVKNRKAIAALANGDTAVFLTSSAALSIKEIYDEIARIETIAQNIGYRLIYSTESDAIKSINSARRPVLIVPPLTKNEVLEVALKKELFVQKTTRHIVPARPLFVNVPLAWLRKTNLKKANQKFKVYLEKKQIIKKESGTIIEGRRYEEPSYVFSDP